MPCDALHIIGLDGVCHGLIDYFTDPFWFYLAWGGLIIATGCALAWFFPVLRSLAGAVAAAVLVGLFGYRKGERDQKARDQREMDRLKRQPGGSGWPWKW